MQSFASLQTLSTAALSATLSFIVCGGRSTPFVAGVEAPLRAADVAEALGVRRLADHHDAVVAAPDRRRGVLAVGHVAARERCSIPSRIVVPGITLVEPPCQVSVQPPAWLPMLSALLPAT